MGKIAQYAVVTTLVGGVALGIYSARTDNLAKAALDSEKSRTEEAKNTQRFKEWAYITKEKEIRPGETVKLVIIPHPLGYEFKDTKCLVYTHQEFKQASMICPDAKQYDISGEND